MKIKGKSEETLIKAYNRLLRKGSKKAGYVKNYILKHWGGIK